VTVISFSVLIYVIALLSLIGAFFWYGVRSSRNVLAAEGTEDAEN
jgi:hypothetical protein